MTTVLTHKKSNKIVSFFLEHRQKIIAPLIGIFVLLVIWQLLCMGEKSNLPSPITVVKETFNPLIINPFFDNGGTDKGLFWQILASLKRVAVGFSLAAIVGVVLGILVGCNPLVFDALGPIFQLYLVCNSRYCFDCY